MVSSIYNPSEERAGNRWWKPVSGGNRRKAAWTGLERAVLYENVARPAAVIRRLHGEAVKALSNPDLLKRLAAQGMDPTPSASPEAFDAEVRAEAVILERVVRQSGARLE